MATSVVLEDLVKSMGTEEEARVVVATPDVVASVVVVASMVDVVVSAVVVATSSLVLDHGPQVSRFWL